MRLCARSFHELQQKHCERSITSLGQALRGLPRQRCVTGRGSRGGGTPRLSSPLRCAAEAPGRGGGPEPGCCSLLPGAQKHPSGKRGFNERGGARGTGTVTALHLNGLRMKSRVKDTPLLQWMGSSRENSKSVKQNETCMKPGMAGLESNNRCSWIRHRQYRCPVKKEKLCFHGSNNIHILAPEVILSKPKSVRVGANNINKKNPPKSVPRK